MDVKNKKLFDLEYVKVFVYFRSTTILIWILVIKITIESKPKKNGKIWINYWIGYIKKIRLIEGVEKVMIEKMKSTKSKTKLM